MSDLSAAFAFLQVILIDVSLSGDNAIIIAMAAAGLPRPQRRNGIAIGIGAAVAMRVLFAILTVSLLDVPGLVLVGGLMLAWVSWKMWSELRASHHATTHHDGDSQRRLEAGEDARRPVGRRGPVDVTRSLGRRSLQSL